VLGEQPQQVELAPFIFRKGSSFVQKRMFKEHLTSERYFYNVPVEVIILNLSLHYVPTPFVPLAVLHGFSCVFIIPMVSV
jgi:hypothetical protein